MPARVRGRTTRELPQKPKPRSDVYTGMLVISLCAMILGCVLLYLDWEQYGQKAPQLPNLSRSFPAGGGPATPAPTPPAGGKAKTQ